MASSMGVEAPELLAFLGLLVTVLSEVVTQISLLDEEVDDAPTPPGDSLVCPTPTPPSKLLPVDLS